jgi:hypothetical protein
MAPRRKISKETATFITCANFTEVAGRGEISKSMGIQKLFSSCYLKEPKRAWVTRELAMTGFITILRHM